MDGELGEKLLLFMDVKQRKHECVTDQLQVNAVEKHQSPED